MAAKVAAVIGLGKALWASFFLEAEYYLLALALKMCVAYGLALATIMSVLCSAILTIASAYDNDIWVYPGIIWWWGSSVIAVVLLSFW